MKKVESGIKNTTEFIDRVQEYYKDQYTYMSGTYINRDSVIQMKCNKCGHDLPRKARQFIKFDCPGCKGVARLNTSSYKDKVFDQVGSDYTVMGEYASGTANILMKHNICTHEWYVISKNFIRSINPTRCPMCSNKSKMNHYDFLKKLSNIRNSSRFEVMNECNGLDTDIHLQCKDCKRDNLRKAVNILDSEYLTCTFCSGHNISNGVRIILDFLERNKITYDLEVYFDNFKSANGNRFKYDIFLEDYDLLIEFDGIQHFQESNHRFNENVRFRDLLKNSKVLLSKYSLLRISYREINDIENILQDLILDEGSTTIQKYNLLFIGHNSEENYNLEKYYTSRSTFKRMETGDTSNYNLCGEDIVSSSSGS